MGVETAETVMFVSATVVILTTAFILVHLLRPAEDDVSERLDPMEPPITEPIEDNQWLADIDAILSGDETATAEPSETVELPAPPMRERRAKLAPYAKRGRWERPKIEVGSGQWYSAFSPPRARGINNFVGRGVIVSCGLSRVTIRLEDGTKTRRRAHNLVPTQPPGPR